MAPAFAASDHPPEKRKRLSSGLAPAAPQHQHREPDLPSSTPRARGDALADASVSLALDGIVSVRVASDAARTRAEASLHAVHDALSRLSTQPAKRFAVDSAALRNTLRRVARGYAPSSLFRSPDFASLALDLATPSKQLLEPGDVNVVGSFLLGLAKPPLVVDVAVQMPSSLFVDGDILNYRYHDKRLLFLLYLARHFVKTEEGKWDDVSILQHPLAADSTKPTLTLRPVANDGTSQPLLRIIPTIQQGLFDVRKLSDSRRNIRATGESSVVTDTTKATPAYNASILVDATPLPALTSLHAAAKACPAFTSAARLLAQWSSRHRLLPSSFATTALLAELIARQRVPGRATREHLVRAALHASSAGALRALRVAGAPAVAGASAVGLSRVEAGAAAALRALEAAPSVRDPWLGVVGGVFGAPRGCASTALLLPLVFDGTLCVNEESGRPVSGTREGEVRDLLRVALVETGRVAAVEPLSPGVFGLVLADEVDAGRKVDVCPASVDADAFAAFWGERAGLRRFRDGRITRAVIWSGGSGTLQEIVDYVSQQHLDGSVQMRVTLDEVDAAAGLGSNIVGAGARAATAFNELASTLRDLDGLPLAVRGVHGASPALRHTAARAMRPVGGGGFVEVMDVVASFESSSKWPDSPVAIAAAKASFYVALRARLGAKGLSARATVSFLDVEVAGLMFRVRLHVDGEAGQLAIARPEQADALIWRTEHVVTIHDAMRAVRNPLVAHAARLTKAWLNAHWLLNSLGERRDELVDLLALAAVDNAAGLRCGSEPRSGLAAFCNVLHLLGEFPWEVCPLVVSLPDADADRDEDGDETMDADEVRRRGEERRDALAAAQKAHDARPVALDVVVARGSELWRWFCGAHAVERVVALRVVATARAALGHLHAVYGGRVDEGDVATAFVSGLPDAVDVLLHLDRRGGGGGAAPPNRPLAAGRSDGGVKGIGMLAGLDPVDEIVGRLRARLGEWAVFFVRERSGDRIGVKWRPAVAKQVKFSLRDAGFRRPVGEEALVVDEDELVEEMLRVGAGLVVRAERVSSGGGD